MRRFACVVFPYRPATSIDTTSPSILRSPCVRLLAPIFPTSHQTQQTSNSHTSPNSLTLSFQGRLFCILSDVLAYVQDFPVD